MLIMTSLFDQIILQLTNVLALETLPELNPWAWHVNAWNHYRTAIILLEEVSVHPHMPKADKIWRILDYVFLQPPGLTPDEKSIAILSDAKERLCVYSRLKKMKVPGNLGPRASPFCELSSIRFLTHVRCRLIRIRNCHRFLTLRVTTQPV